LAINPKVSPNQLATPVTTPVMPFHTDVNKFDAHVHAAENAPVTVCHTPVSQLATLVTVETMPSQREAKNTGTAFHTPVKVETILVHREAKKFCNYSVVA
jgi:hypothetical protein